MQLPDAAVVLSVRARIYTAQVPLGHNYKFPDINIYSKGHWSPEEALFTAHNLVVAARPGQVRRDVSCLQHALTRHIASHLD
jgi:hypothetical protein